MEKIINRYLYEEGRIPSSYGDNTLTPDEVDVEAYKDLKNIYDNINEFVSGGYNLLIYGKTPGNGKTSWACKLATVYTTKGFWKDWYITNPVIYINIPLYMMKVKEAINNKEVASEVASINKNIENAKIVIWDDFTSTYSDYELSVLYAFVDYRVANRLTNIYTTNVVEPEKFNALGSKLISRIISTSDKVHIQGTSHRHFRFKEIINND